jgi:uncharacterized protein (DUF608 family)
MFILAMTYVYEGQREFGVELARRTVAEVVRRGWCWDWPVALDTAQGPRTRCDYYQNLMLWALPAAVEGQDSTAACKLSGLPDGTAEAGKACQTMEDTRTC